MMRIAIAAPMLWSTIMLLSGPSYADLGRFERNADVGQVSLPGSARFEPTAGRYQITGGGANMWGDEDAFHFAWRRVSGDLRLSTQIAFVGSGGDPHRKAGWMVRQDLDPNAAYIDAVVHGDGLTSLQYRAEKGGQTQEIQSPVKSPTALLLERDGNVFTFSVTDAAGVLHPVGSMVMVLNDPVYVGLAVCAHDDTRRETAVFAEVQMQTPGVVPDEHRILESTLETIDIETGLRRIVHRARDHFEAPNWSPDGKTLVFNSRGRLYTIPPAGGTPQQIESGLADRCNNDHGFSPDGKWLALSHNTADKGSLIYILPSEGGEPRPVTRRGPSYWHGWSPDGKTLTYCAERNDEYDVYTIGIQGGPETRLTTAPGLDDGPEYSPDGKHIYFNSVRTGTMRIWRMRTDGRQQKQMTFDEDYADWFPHPSPDGKWLVFLSYDKSVVGHPANEPVTLRLMPASGGRPRILAHLFGGQGTINVPSWSPDSTRVAFVSYRLRAPETD